MDGSGAPVVRRPTINVLQAGRGLAALAVVLHHSALGTLMFGGGNFPGQRFFEFGYLGIDFFFVLSGFIISYSMDGSTKPAGRYVRDRFRRVYAPYLPIGIAMALAYSFLPGFSAAGSREWSWLASLTLAPIQAETALSVAWTLKHELVFYAVFGIAFYSGYLCSSLIVWGVLIVCAQFVGLEKNIILSLINLEFLVGVVVCLLYRRQVRYKWGWLLAVPFVMLWLWFGEKGEASLFFGLAIGPLLFTMIGLERGGHLDVPRYLIFLGSASYSIYLVHDPIVSVAARLVPVTGSVHLLFVAVIATLGGLGYFWLVERRLVSSIRGLPKTRGVVSWSQLKGYLSGGVRQK